MKTTVLILSCTHAVNNVPDELMSIFLHHHRILQSPRAFDTGCLELTQQLSQHLGCEYTSSSVTHLLVDCNRPPKNDRCFSRFTRNLSENLKQQLIDQYYLPFNQATHKLIQEHIDAGEQVLHVSLRTFKPILHGLYRNAAIGLLYDPHRHAEKEVARIWRGLFLQQTPAYRVRMNYPYAGIKFNLQKTLRKYYAESDYLGLQLTVNHALLDHIDTRTQMTQAIYSSLSELLQLL